MTKTFKIVFFFLFLSGSVVAQTEKENKDARYRLFINDFIQTYQQAYEKKEIDYIEKFFSNDALIITETKELSKHGAEMVPSSNKKRPYKLLVEDKKKYIIRLRDVFNKNIKIKLSVAGKRIVQHSLYPEIYGVSFLQLWVDQDKGVNLEDDMPGYIFMMVDFRKNESRPIVHVRTWQPIDNVKAPKDKFSIMDFRVYDF